MLGVSLLVYSKGFLVSNKVMNLLSKFKLYERINQFWSWQNRFLDLLSHYHTAVLPFHIIVRVMVSLLVHSKVFLVSIEVMNLLSKVKLCDRMNRFWSRQNRFLDLLSHYHIDVLPFHISVRVRCLPAC